MALALALSIPDALPEQQTFVAMTAGVVIATLLINATTIGALVRYLGLDRPDHVGRFVAAAARFADARTAREELPRARLQRGDREATRRSRASGDR